MRNPLRVDAVDGRMGFKRGERGNYSGYGSPECASLDAGPVEMLEPLLAALSSGEATPDVSLRQLVRTFPEGLPMRHRAKVWNLMLGLDGKQAKAVVQLDRARLDEPNQRVIKSDVERTRAHIPFFARPETRADLEAILTYFCKVKNLRYKQGLNEVLGPLYYLKSDEFDIAGVFTLFYAFVSRYLPVYQDEDFTTLQCTFHLFNHLLLYHDPALAVFLRDNGVSPELYVTPWFLTAFASKTQINHLLCLWDYYIAEDDRFFYCFIALALLVLYRELLFETEVSQIPETLTRITIQSFEDLQRLWKLAKQLKVTTPSSFAFRMSHCQVLKASELRRLEGECAFYLLSRDVVKHCVGSSGAPTASRPWKLLILDIRSEWELSNGRLPPAIHLDLETDWQLLVKKIVMENEEAVLDTIPAVKAADAESPQSSYYFPNGGYGTGVFIPTKVPRRALAKQSSYHHICIVGGDDDADAVRVYKILTEELKLRWISVAQGGFRECHKEMAGQRLDLVDHDPALCSVCNPKAKVESRARDAAGDASGTSSGGNSLFSMFKRATGNSKKCGMDEKKKEQDVSDALEALKAMDAHWTLETAPAPTIAAACLTGPNALRMNFTCKIESLK
ncbi:MAG: uncharacterized protein KVP18_000390 [Porospora cf. gigantea A]|uniref:uncharacterized protein n=1 Tax=Porospora cf. gigantea A TaxID=2853593 RepID=UPI0035598670|nr:MAG: hypothetical protein KVP18_000390 [Porospora cf. gigantea A]